MPCTEPSLLLYFSKYLIFLLFLYQNIVSCYYHLSISLLQTFVFFHRIVESQNVKKISPDPTYVTLGDTLVLNVTYDFTGKVAVLWRNDSGALLHERSRLGGEDNPDKSASLEGQATLILKNTALYDNGTYTVLVTTSSTAVSKTFDVIIQRE